MPITYPDKDIAKLIEKFIKMHPTTVRTSKTVPSKQEGIEGDTVIVRRGTTVAFYIKTDGIWHRFDKLSTLQSVLSSQPIFDTLSGSFNGGVSGATAGGTNHIWLPLSTGITEVDADSLGTTTNEFVLFIVPFDTKVLKVLLRATAEPATTSIQIYKASNGTTSPATAVSSSVTRNMSVDDTTYSFNFESDYKEARLAQGDAMAIKMSYTGTAPGDVNFTVAMNYSNINKTG